MLKVPPSISIHVKNRVVESGILQNEGNLAIPETTANFDTSSELVLKTRRQWPYIPASTRPVYHLFVDLVAYKAIYPC